MMIGLYNTQSGTVFGLNRNSVADAKESPHSLTDLKLPKTKRNKMKKKRPLLKKYFKTLSTKSGILSFFFICHLYLLL